jgi:hypothetical protein
MREAYPLPSRRSGRGKRRLIDAMYLPARSHDD